ncbi:glycosyltransferase family 1 protein [Aerococcaceae bacterium DSM 111021]|nr:glycosyltransferase family 1 protein [Aerococcaceae bacterium DSM 111021]
MRIAIITETFVPATDGICTRLANFVVQLKDSGHEVIVISPELGINNYKGVPVYGLETVTFPLYGSRPWGLPSRKVKTIFKQFKPDVVHAVNPISLGSSAVHYANKLNIPLITSYHTHLPNYLDHYNMSLLKPVLWEYIRYWHTKSDFNITVSQSLMNELNDEMIPTQGVLPRGIDIDGRHPDFFDQELYDELTFNEPSHKLLVYVGRLAPEKDIEHLRAMFDHRNDLCLAIVGDGPDRERLEEVFAGTKTSFLGFKHGEDLSKAFATGDAFVFPSTSETFGLVISEAMASGIPVIAAKSDPTVEQITDMETGLIYESGNTESLMEAINYIDNPLLMQKLSLKGRSEAMKYTWDNATINLLDFYTQTIETHQYKFDGIRKQA